MAKRSKADSPALPGMEASVVAMGARPGDVDMRDAKVFTAGVLFKDHPDLFKSICTARFKHSLPVSWIAEMFRVSEHTVRAIETYVLESQDTDPARAAFFIQSGVNKSRLLANKIAVDLLRQRMEERPESLSVADILQIIEATTAKSSESNMSPKAESDVVDAELIDSFDSVLNGLEEGKKCARDGDGQGMADDDRESESGTDGLESGTDGLESGTDGLESGTDGLESGTDGLESGMDGLESGTDGQEKDENCSTKSCGKVSRSMEKSDDTHINQGIRDTLSNSLSNIGEKAEENGEDAEGVGDGAETAGEVDETAGEFDETAGEVDETAGEVDETGPADRRGTPAFASPSPGAGGPRGAAREGGSTINVS